MSNQNISGVEAIRQLIEAQKNWHVFRAKKENNKNTIYVGDTSLTEEELVGIKTGSQPSNEGPPSEGIEYKLSDDGTYAICTGRGRFADTSLVIAPEYQDKPVTHIGRAAFSDINYQFPDLVNVVLPNTITHIENAAFSNCRIEQINIPDSVIYIGDHAFYQNHFTNINIPDGVTSIGDDVFSGCSSLTSIEIPDGVTSIGSSAFYNCSSLKSITIPNSVTSIGDWAFYYCSNLISIIIPDGVTSIGEYAFGSCTSLTIYCEATEQPSDWSTGWNPDNKPVSWGYASDLPGVNEKISQINTAIETLQNELGDIESALDAIIAIQQSLTNGGGKVEEIAFTIDGTEYAAIDGMTWEEWCDSKYNTIYAYISDIYVQVGLEEMRHSDFSRVTKDEQINTNENYIISA